SVVFVATTIPFTSAENDAHVPVFPRVRTAGHVIGRIIEVAVVVVVAVEELLDVESRAHADDVADPFGVAKTNIDRVITAEARATDRDMVPAAIAARKIEHVMHDHVFVTHVGLYAIGRMNPLVVPALRVNRVRAVNGHTTGVDIPRHGIYEAKIL